jgi:[lysine-biosynthesis-protein LysW]--L-2-aminoadipate ligase
MRFAILCSRIRVEEKLLLAELDARGLVYEPIDVRHLVLDSHDAGPWRGFDLVIDRCISQVQAEALLEIIESHGVLCSNSAHVRRVCGNKLLTTLALRARGVPTPAVKIAVDEESALAAVELNGYPAVIKPVFGSWGRLLARVNDRHAAEAVIEHKATLGGLHHNVFYVQPYIDKPNYDIRTFVIGDKAIGGIRRRAEHWITNTARGATAEACVLSADLARWSVEAAAAVGGGAVAVDFFETRDGRLAVNEVNATMEFRNSIGPMGVNIPGKLVDYYVALAEARAAAPSAGRR